jgi:F-type H+-transporting ATPase subunit gamma
MSLKHIKLKIQSVKKTAKVTRAMEAVSAVKMRKAQERAVGARGYARAAMRILQQVSGALEKTNHPLVSSSHAKKVAIVIITSDKGLAGALNSSVLKSVQRLTTSLGVKGSDVVALCIGKRGYEFAQRRGFKGS